jgi:hypothetical protein
MGEDVVVTSSSATAPRGLYDGFEAYRTPSDDDYRDLLTRGTVVVDTNVLLNLYRYNAQTRADLVAVLERLEGPAVGSAPGTRRVLAQSGVGSQGFGGDW